MSRALIRTPIPFPNRTLRNTMNPSSPNEPHRDSDLSPVIELVRADLARRGRGGIGRILTVVAIVLLAILLLTALLRVVGLFVVRSEISASTGEIAVVSGFDERVTDWLTGTVSFVTSFLVAGSVLQILLAFFLPGVKGPRLVRSALLVIGATGFFAITPGIVGSFRGVDGKGLPSQMTEVDPETVNWFTPDNAALIFYADHLDGERRFWNRPGYTPKDAAMAQPVTPEVRRAWEEATRRKAMEKELERKEAEAAAKRAEEEAVAAALAAERKREAAVSPVHPARVPTVSAAPAAVVPAPTTVRHMTAEEFLAADRERSIRTRWATEISPSASTPAPAADFTFELIPGRVLEIRLDGRSVEIWSDGSAELCRPGGEDLIVIGPGSRRTLHQYAKLYAEPVGQRSARLYLRWIDTAVSRSAPMVQYLIPAKVPPTSPPASAPRSIGIVQATARPPVAMPQRIPLTLGRTTEVRVLGDEVECWADGPVIVGAAGSGVRELAAGQRLRVSGAAVLHVGPAAVETTSLHIVRLRSAGTR